MTTQYTFKGLSAFNWQVLCHFKRNIKGHRLVLISSTLAVFLIKCSYKWQFFFCQAILVHECIWVWEWSFWIILLKCTTAYRTGGFYLSLKGAQNPRQTGFEDLIFILCSFFCCSFCSSCTFICHAFFKSVLLCPHLSEHNSVQLYHQTSFSSHFLHFCPVFTFSVNCE